jgi:hypothetical protein
MTNPTSNFGWQMPTSTDLVTDLPADFEVFGQAVDTSLADLKGGTTGQVLAKASNTDMDFVWSADASGIPASAFTAKGVILVGTGTSTYTGQTVGTNGQVLTANSAQADGVEWATPASGGMTLLSTTTLSGATTTISSIDQTYKDLQIVYYGFNLTTASYPEIEPNSTQSIVTGIFGVASGVATSDNGNLLPYSGNANLLAASTNNAGVCTIYNYANTTFFKPFTLSSRHTTGTSAPRATSGSGAIQTTSAITSLLFRAGSSFSGGTVLIYGVK